MMDVRLAGSYSLCTMAIVSSELQPGLTVDEKDLVEQLHKVVLGDLSSNT